MENKNKLYKKKTNYCEKESQKMEWNIMKMDHFFFFGNILNGANETQ